MGSGGACYLNKCNQTWGVKNWNTLFIGCLWSDNVILWTVKAISESTSNWSSQLYYSKGWRMKTWEMSRSGSAAEAGARAGAKLELSVSALVSYNPSLLSRCGDSIAGAAHWHWSGSEHWKSADLTFAILHTTYWRLLRGCAQLWQSCIRKQNIALEVSMKV